MRLDSYFHSVGGELGAFLQGVRDKKNISAFGMRFGDRTVISSLFPPFVYVCADYVAAQRAAEQFASAGRRTVFLPAKDDVLTYASAKSTDGMFRRLAALAEIIRGTAAITVIAAEALSL